MNSIAIYNKIYLPKEVFQFNWENPSNSFCDLPLLSTSCKEPVDEEEDSTNILAPQLALTRRFLYQAFKFNANQIMPLCVSLEAAVQLQTTSKHLLFQPLYPSKSMVIAASLLNNAFLAFFNAFGVRQSKQREMFQLMCQKDPFSMKNVKCSPAKRVLPRFITNLFPLSGASSELLQQPFYTLWVEAIASFPAVNRYCKKPATTL